MTENSISWARLNSWGSLSSAATVHSFIFFISEDENLQTQFFFTFQSPEYLIFQNWIKIGWNSTLNPVKFINGNSKQRFRWQSIAPRGGGKLYNRKIYSKRTHPPLHTVLAKMISLSLFRNQIVIKSEEKKDVYI